MYVFLFFIAFFVGVMVASRLSISFFLNEAGNVKRNQCDKALEWSGDENLQDMLGYLAFLESAYLAAFKKSLALIFEGVEDKPNFSQDTIRQFAVARLHGTRPDREMCFLGSVENICADLSDMLERSNLSDLSDMDGVLGVPDISDCFGLDEKQPKIVSILSGIKDAKSTQSFFSAWERCYNAFILQYMRLALEKKEGVSAACSNAWVTKIQMEERWQNADNFWGILDDPEKVAEAFLKADQKVLCHYCPSDP